jgi:hypothetical protein
MPRKIASSPIPETEVLVISGAVGPPFAPANIFSFCIETVTVTFDAFQLHPVLAIGEPALALAPTVVLT